MSSLYFSVNPTSFHFSWIDKIRNNYIVRMNKWTTFILLSTLGMINKANYFLHYVYIVSAFLMNLDITSLKLALYLNILSLYLVGIHLYWWHTYLSKLHSKCYITCLYQLFSSCLIQVFQYASNWCYKQYPLDIVYFNIHVSKAGQW